MLRLFLTPELGLLISKLQEHSTSVPTLSSMVWPLQFLRTEVERICNKAPSALEAGGERERKIRGTTGPDSTQQGHQSCIKTILNSLVAHPFRFILLPQYHMLLPAH